jgi:hypothetical protein
MNNEATNYEKLPMANHPHDPHDPDKPPLTQQELPP